VADHGPPYQKPGPDECRCYLPVKPPEGVDWWRPDLDDDPGPQVKSVARVGEDPLLCRAIRTGHGWIERGAKVDFYLDRTPPMPWSRTGICWAHTPHPVIACEPWPL
jgi:hypothetical protein